MENSTEYTHPAEEWQEERIRKPELEPITSPPNWGKTVFTMLLFVLMFKLLGVDMLAIIGLVVVVTIHEAGHFVAMRLFGYQNVSMFFVPLLGAFVSGEKRETPPGAEIIMLLAGPVPGILIGLGLLTWHPNFEVVALGFMFLLLNLFNMLPFLPLDGGRIFDCIFARENLIIRMGLLVMSLLALLAFIFLTGSFIIGILGLGIVQNMVSTIQMIQTRKQMDQAGLSYRKCYSQLTDEEYAKMAAFVEEEYEGFDTEQEKAHQVASLLSRTSPRQLSIGEGIGYFVLWAFFIVFPLVVMSFLPLEGLQHMIMFR